MGTGTVEDVVGNPVGTEHPFHRGGLQPRKTKFGFSKKKPNTFVMS